MTAGALPSCEAGFGSACPPADTIVRADQDIRSVVRCHATFDAAGLQNVWSSLSQAGLSATLFNTFDWCRCWAETVGRHTRPQILQILDGSGNTIGLAPLYVESSGLVRWAGFMGRDRVSGDHLDLLCAPGQVRQCVDAVTDYFERGGRRVDGLIFGELDPNGTTRRSLIDWAERQARPWVEREPRVVPFIDLPDSFEMYLATRAKKRRSKIRRNRRELEQTPGATVRLDTESTAVTRVLETFYELHRQRWAENGIESNYQEPGLRSFLDRFCQTMAGQGGLRCYTLEIQGEPHAVLIAFHWRDTAYFYQTGRRPDCPLESPGQILIAESIEQAIREGLKRYDFLRGDEAYKRYWTSQQTEQTTLVVACRLPARTALIAERLKARTRAFIQQRFGPQVWERFKRLSSYSTGSRKLT